MNVEALSQHAKDFADAVALFDFAAVKRQQTGSGLFGRWQFLAARQGIVSIFNYRMAMDGALKMRGSCPRWVTHFDNTRLEAVKVRFRDEFKHTKELRQSLLHNSEMFWNPTNYKTNAIIKGASNRYLEIPPGAQVIADANLMNSTYTVQFVGQLFELELSCEKLETLIAITREFYSALKFPEHPLSHS